ncbi:unnamed protein product [Closterium sp. NIES-53]
MEQRRSSWSRGAKETEQRRKGGGAEAQKEMGSRGEGGSRMREERSVEALQQGSRGDGLMREDRIVARCSRGAEEMIGHLLPFSSLMETAAATSLAPTSLQCAASGAVK